MLPCTCSVVLHKIATTELVFKTIINHYIYFIIILCLLQVVGGLQT